MAGGRLFSFREGDRSEYLAQYLLSGLGLATSVPRQEDIGFDFVCSIADDGVRYLTFNHQYIVSVKSIGNPNVLLDAPEAFRDDLPHINWLFRLDLPLFLAVIDKEKSEMLLYSTLPIWLLWHMGERQECGALRLLPRVASSNVQDVGFPKKGAQIKDWPNKYVFEVDLGHPIVRITPEIIKNTSLLNQVKAKMRFAIHFGSITTRHARMGVPHFYWFAKTTADASLATLAFISQPVPNVEEAKKQVYESIAPTMASLAMLFKLNNDMERLQAAGKVLKDAADFIPQQIKEKLPEIFS